MTLATFTTGTHDATCSGCPACRADHAQLLDRPIRRVLCSAAPASARFTTMVAADDDAVPPPPDLNARIKAAAAARNGEPTLRSNASPVTVAQETTNPNGVPDPPDLNALIRAARGVR